jgi:fluoride exporter
VNPWIWLAIAAAGAGGSVLRYLVDSAVGARTFSAFPFGTLTVNLSGSAVYGAITGLALYHAFPATPKLLLGAGACGAYTTFSTFALESVLLAREGERLDAVLNLVANVVGGCLAASIGLALSAL